MPITGPDRGCLDAEFRRPAEPLETVLVVAVALVDPDGRVLIAKRPEGKPMAGLWEFPGGKIGAGEELEEALARELSEEIGVQMLASDHLMSLRHEYPDRHVEIDFFLVTQWQNEARGLAGQSLKWVTVDALAEVDLLPADLPVIGKLQSLYRF